MPTTQFKFGELEAILADLNDIPSASRTAFQARLKNFHRLGFPSGIGGGRGKAARYGVGELVQMAVAVEMTQLGLTPERAIAVIQADEYAMLMAVRMAAQSLVGAHPDTFDPDIELPEENNPSSMFLYFDPSTLSPWSDDTTEDLASATFFYGGEGIVRENLTKWTTGPTRRLALINVTAMLWWMAAWIDDDKLDDFFTEIADWADWLMTRADFDLDQWVCGPVRRLMTDHAANPIHPWKSDWAPGIDGLDCWTPLKKLVDAAGYGEIIPTYKLDELETPLFVMPDQEGDDPKPNMIINLPGQRTLFVDEKTVPALDCPSDSIQWRLEQLAERPYSGQFTDRTKYTILYLPDVRWFTAAAQEDKRIWERAFDQNVLIATPSTMVQILKAAETAWEAAAAWEAAKPEERERTLTEGVIRWPR